MGIGKATPIRIGVAVVLAAVLFVVTVWEVSLGGLLALVPICALLLAGYHAYDGGSRVTAMLITVVVAGGMMVGQGVEDLGSCPPVPTCPPSTPLEAYLELTAFAAALGIAAYLVGGLARRLTPPSRPPASTR